MGKHVAYNSVCAVILLKDTSKSLEHKSCVGWWCCSLVEHYMRVRTTTWNKIKNKKRFWCCIYQMFSDNIGKSRLLYAIVLLYIQYWGCVSLNAYTKIGERHHFRDLWVTAWIRHCRILCVRVLGIQIDSFLENSTQEASCGKYIYIIYDIEDIYGHKTRTQ